MMVAERMSAAYMVCSHNLLLEQRLLKSAIPGVGGFNTAPLLLLGHLSAVPVSRGPSRHASFHRLRVVLQLPTTSVPSRFTNRTKMRTRGTYITWIGRLLNRAWSVFLRRVLPCPVAGFYEPLTN